MTEKKFTRRRSQWGSRSKQAEDGDGRHRLTSAPQLQQYVHTSKATYGGYRKGWFIPSTVIITSTVQGAWVRCRIMRAICAVERIGLELFDGLCCFCHVALLLSLLHPSLLHFLPFSLYYFILIYICVCVCVAPVMQYSGVRCYEVGSSNGIMD